MKNITILASISILLLVTSLPAFAQSQFVPSSSSLKDFIETYLHKVQSSSQQSGLQNQQFANVTSEAGKAVTSAIDLFGAVKYLLAALVGVIAPMIFGVSIPWWFTPAVVWGMVLVSAYAIYKHLWKIVFVGLIIIIILFVFLLFGAPLIPH